MNYVNIGDIILANVHNQVFAGSLVSFLDPVYNSDDLLISATINGREYEFNHNGDGQMIEAKDTKFVQTITYDSDGRLFSITTTEL